MRDGGTPSEPDEAAAAPDEEFLCPDSSEPETECVRLAAARGALALSAAPAQGDLTSSDRRWFGPKVTSALAAPAA